jgi:hypothetical protein
MPSRARLLPYSLPLLYAALAFAVFANTWASPRSHWIGADPDPSLFVWHLRWLPFALGEGHTPFISDYLNYPDGFNLLWNTSVLFPAFVLAPVTLLFGAVLSYNLLVTVSLALSAWCAYLALRRYVRSEEAAAIGGLLYGFSPFMFAQAGGHPHMTLAVYPPLVLILLDEILVRRRHSPILLGASLGAATGIQLLTGEELVAITFLVACIAAALLALLHRARVRARLADALRAVAAAVAVTAAIDAYPLSVQLGGAQRVSGAIHPHNVFVLDLLSFVVPGQRQQLTFDSANDLAAHYSGLSELGGYVGIPLLLLTCFVLARHRRDPLVRFFGLLLAAVVLLALGPRLHVAGHSLPVRLPWVIPQRLPFFESVLPARLAVIMFLLLGLLLAVFIDRFPRGSQNDMLALGALVAVALVPLLPSLPFPSATSDTPSFFSSGAHAIPKGSVALVAPLAGVAGGTTRPLLWQAESALRFRMPESYVVRPAPSTPALENDSPLFNRMVQLQAGAAMSPITSEARRRILCQLVRLDIATIAVGPMHVGRAETVRMFRSVLDRAPVETGGVELWPGVLVAARRAAGGCP